MTRKSDLKTLIRPLSPSKLADLKFGCGLYLKYRRIDKVNEGPSKPRDEGAILHKFQAAYSRHCHSAKQFSDLSIVSELLDRSIAEFISEGGNFSELCRDDLLDLAYKIADMEPVELHSLRAMEQKTALDSSGRLIDWNAARKRKEGHWGILDKLCYDEESGVATIKDLKTGYGRSVDQDQLMMYAYLASRLLPDAQKFELVFQYIRPHQETESYPGDGLYYTRDQIQAFIDDLESAKLPSLIEQNQDFKPSPGPRCEKCPYAAICDYKASQPGEINNEAQARSQIRDVIHLRAKADKKVKSVRSWIKKRAELVSNEEYSAQLKDIPMEDRIEIYNNLRIKVDDEMVGYSEKKSVTWPTESLVALLESLDIDPVGLMVFDKKKLNMLFKKNPDIARAADALKSTDKSVRWSGT